MAKITKIIRNWVEYELGWAEPNVIAVTQAEYNALSTAEKNDGKLRIIKDAPSVDLGNIIVADPDSPIKIEKIWCWTEDQYSALSSYSDTTAYLTV